MKPLILGDGLLGTELYNITGWDVLSRNKDKIDAYKFDDWKNLLLKYDTIINAIAYTSTYSASSKHYDVNYKFVVLLSDFCKINNIKLIHISTLYVYLNNTGVINESTSPLPINNQYGTTKLLADYHIMNSNSNYLIFRSIFKQNPFPYAHALSNYYGHFDYVDVIAKIMVTIINNNGVGLINIGTEYKSMADLAKRTKPDILINDTNTPFLSNISLDLSLMNSWLYLK